MRSKNIKKYAGWICAGILFLLTLFMVKVEIGKVYTDFRTHSLWAVGELTESQFDKFYAYPLWHFAVKTVNVLLPIGREWSAAFVTACCISLTAVILYRFLEKELGGRFSWMQLCVLDMGLLILTAVYMPWFNREVYLGQSSPTIWHNPTNMAVKPLALLIFLCFVQLYERYEKTEKKKLCLMAFLLLVSCFVKPSFIQGFLPAVVLFLVIELFRTKGKSFCFSLRMAAVFIPSGFYFLYQFLSMFGESSSRTIGINPFAVMRLDTVYPLISMLQAAAFPLFALCVMGVKKVWKDKTLLFSVIFYLVCLAQFIFFIEVTEAASGNFEWAYQLALFTFFIVTLVRFVQMERKPKWASWMGYGIFAYHVCSGIYYYLSLFFWNPWQC